MRVLTNNMHALISTTKNVYHFVKIDLKAHHNFFDSIGYQRVLVKEI